VGNRRHWRGFGLVGLVLIGALALPLPASRAQFNGGTGAAATTNAASANGARRAAEQITAKELKEYLQFVASDEMEGRDTPSRGLDLTAKFIALNLSLWGVKPAGDDNTYFQRIALRRSKVNPEGTSAEIDGQKFTFGSGFLAAGIGGTASGPLVYAGHGWVVKSKNINAYAGLDVKDKIIVTFAGRSPKGVSLSELGEARRGEDWFDPATYAQTAGARGIIVIPDSVRLNNWETLRQNSVKFGRPVVERFQKQYGTPVPTITASREMIEALFRGESMTGADALERAAKNDPGQSFAFSPNKRVSFTVSAETETVYTQNVVGVVEGSDPTLKNEYVAIGAHYDHVGVGNPVNGDAIYNGADDDGSGTVSVLAIAHAFAAHTHPRRSILFVWHAGEEKGLWGSRYFTEQPTVPLDKIITQLNIDMIGRSKKAGDTNPRNKELTGPNEIYVIGSKMMSTELGLLSERVNASYLNLSFNYKYDDPKDPNRFFFRSDHFNYAQKGIPIIFYFDGVHEDYHRPSDSPDKIDYEKMQKVARTVFMTAAELANADRRPQVDKALPSELTSR
jgi:Zn-dependent M28 family amino/carboxypeptidase